MQRLRDLAASRPAFYFQLGAILLAVLGLALVAAATQRQITLVLDGTPQRMVTHARTVGAALRDAGLRLEPGDVSIPGPQAALADGDLIEVRRARQVHIEIDEAAFDIESTEVLPENILAEAGVRLFPGDRVWADGLPSSPGTLPAGGPSRLRVERAVVLTLNQAGQRRRLAAASATLGEALWESGIRLRHADVLFPGPGVSLGGSTGVNFSPARPLTITADGAAVISWASGETVGEALADAGVPLTGLDTSIPSPESVVPRSGSVRVVRVVESAEMETESLPFGSGWGPAPEIEIDRQQLLDPGEGGLKVSRTRVRFEDGVETGRRQEPVWIAVEPRDRIMGYGTKIVIRTLETPNGPIEYWRAVAMYATAYHPCGSAGEPGKCYYGTASGVPVAKGVAAVTVRWFLAMRGQRVYVPGYGAATIADTGGGIPGRYWIDLAYGSAEEYVSWHQWVTVYFLTPVPPEGAILYILP